MTGIHKVAEGLFELPEDDLEKGYLVGGRCGCGGISFPARVVCPFCLTDGEIEKIPLGKKGRLYTFTVNRQAPQGFTAPYITGKVDLPEKVRLFSIITGVGAEEDALSIGQEMELFFGPVTRDQEGRELIGYLFRPAAKPSSRE